MRDYMYNLAHYMQTCLKAGEDYLCNYQGEDSEFVRLNHNKIRQAGSVKQAYADITLYEKKRHASETITITGNKEEDQRAILYTMGNLRTMLTELEEDPYFLVAEEVNSTESIRENQLSGPETALESIITQGQGLDLVGIYAQGGIQRGFMNSYGQRNWAESTSYNFDWSIYYKEDKAVKSAYAGYTWDEQEFQAKMQTARQELEILSRPIRQIAPGKYRVYMTPAALASVIEVLCWGGFSEKEMRTKNSPLIRMVDDGAILDKAITIREHVKEGIAPPFQTEGFIKPETLTLLDSGKYNQSLVSPRTAQEYNLPTNGASGSETPGSIEMASGTITEEEIVTQLNTGVYINNLWYLNYSDRSACRITGMTRFACFWVENGKIEAPIGVMRFDETIYNMLGKNLAGLTAAQSLLIDPETYGGRGTGSMRLPGIIVKDFCFTL